MLAIVVCSDVVDFKAPGAAHQLPAIACTKWQELNTSWFYTKEQQPVNTEAAAQVGVRRANVLTKC